MEENKREFNAAYGEVMLLAHIIEDLVALHIWECSWFRVNGYSGPSRKKILAMSHEQRIDELPKVYAKQEDAKVKHLVSALHLLRRIRNKMTHAFITEVGSDLEKEEGLDQVMAMLEKTSYWQRVHLGALRKAHEAVQNAAITQAWERLLEREDPPFDARVARSKIQEYLDQMDSEMK